TYYGGSGITPYGVAVDIAGNGYITGSAGVSANLPTTTGAYQTSSGGGTDGFLAKFNPNLSGSASLVYGTYLGGSGGDISYGIAVDAMGEGFVTGNTGSTNFPTTTGAFQTTLGSATTKAFVTKLNAAGSALLYSTYLGGSGSDQGNAIAINAAGNAFVTGQETSTNFPTTTGVLHTTNGGGTDAFVTQMNTAGTGVVFSTYLGGSGTDKGFGIAVDGQGRAIVAGETASTNFPTQSPLQSTNGGGNDAFL